MEIQELEALEKSERTGFFARIASAFSKSEVFDGEELDQENELTQINHSKVRASYRYHITIRRTILSFQDAVACADGLKRGEQQILNLNSTDPVLKEKIKDFMCGVNYAQEGSWEEVGESIYLLAPAQAYVEVAPASPRMSAMRN